MLVETFQFVAEPGSYPGVLQDDYDYPVIFVLLQQPLACSIYVTRR